MVIYSFYSNSFHSEISAHINLRVCNINLKSSIRDEEIVGKFLCMRVTYKYIMFPKPNINFASLYFPSPPFRRHHRHHHHLTLRIFSALSCLSVLFGVSFVYFKSTCKMVLRNIKCFCWEKQTNKQKTKEKKNILVAVTVAVVTVLFACFFLGRQNKNINILRCWH